MLAKEINYNRSKAHLNEQCISIINYCLCKFIKNSNVILTKQTKSIFIKI